MPFNLTRQTEPTKMQEQHENIETRQTKTKRNALLVLAFPIAFVLVALILFFIALIPFASLIALVYMVTHKGNLSTIFIVKKSSKQKTILKNDYKGITDYF